MSDVDAENGDSRSDFEISMTERFSALFEHMQEGVALHELICDARGKPVDYRILDVNAQYERHTGLKRSEVAGQLGSVIYQTAEPPYLEQYASVALSGQGRHLKTYFAPLQRYFSISVAPLGPRAFATISSDVTLAQQQAEALEINRLSQRALLDNHPHLIWLKDREGRFLAVNKAFAQACAQSSPEAMVGKTDLDVWPTALAEAYRADDVSVMQQRSQKIVEEPLDTTAGIRWVETYKSPVFAPDGSVIGTTGVARDITEQKRAEQAAEQARQELARFFAVSVDPLCIANTEGRFLKMNPAWEQMLGFPLAQLEGTSFLELVHPDDVDATLESIARLNEGQTVIDFQNRYRHADGSWRWIEWRSTPDEQGRIYAVARDVTRRLKDEMALRAAERAAARSREEMLSVAELAHIGHFTFDYDSHAIAWTRELYLILGLDPATSPPASDLGISHVHPDDVEAVQAAGTAAAKHQTATRLNVRIVRPNGEVRHCLSIVEGDVDETGKVRVVGLVQDLTELRRAEEEQRKLEQKVMQSQKLESLGVLAGGIAHDFNNLLTSILGNADLARRNLSTAHPACTYLEAIETVSRRAADLCRQMLAYSGKGRFVVQALSLNDVVREMAHLLSVSISKKVVIKYDFFADLPSVMADATQVRQVVMNLITNASEAIGEISGVVTLATGVMDCDADYLRSSVSDASIRPPGQYVYLEVSDTGCGMDSETLGRIFDPFFTTKFTGRGLGLAAVMGIVRGHQGALRVCSEEGRGTTIRILLPAYHQTAQPAECAEPGPEQWRGTGLVLVADDEESIRSMARRILQLAGFEVIVAADGREAVEQYQRHRDTVRLVILDMTMPHLDGEACFRELKTIDPQVKVIMTSGYNEQEVVSRFADQGLVAFVQKPYKAVDLLSKMRVALEDQ